MVMAVDAITGIKTNYKTHGFIREKCVNLWLQ